MPRCKHCLTKAEPENGLCRVCGIVQDKNKAALSPEEKKVRFYARGIRAAAMFHLIGSGAGIIMVTTGMAPAMLLLLAFINLLLALGLDRFAMEAYKSATIYYFFIGMVNVISIQHGVENLAGIVLALVGLYLIGNKTSKAIFDRRAKEVIDGY